MITTELTYLTLVATFAFLVYDFFAGLCHVMGFDDEEG